MKKCLKEKCGIGFRAGYIAQKWFITVSGWNFRGRESVNS